MVRPETQIFDVSLPTARTLPGCPRWCGRSRAPSRSPAGPARATRRHAPVVARRSRLTFSELPRH